MNFNISEVVQFNDSFRQMPVRDFSFFEVNQVESTEFEEKLIEKYKNWQKNDDEEFSGVNRHAGQKFGEKKKKGKEEIELLMAICEGISRKDAKEMLIVTGNNVEEAEKLFYSRFGNEVVGEIKRIIQITFVLPYNRTFGRSYLADSLMWEVSADVYKEVRAEAWFQVYIQELDLVLDCQALKTMTFTQCSIPLHSTFFINFA